MSRADERTSRFIQVRGTFRAQTTANQTLRLRLKVWDTRSEQYVQQVWQPHPETGEYFMLLAPGVRYTLYIQPQGFMPYEFSVNLPEKLFAYTLSQTIEFEELLLLGEPIGQKAAVIEHKEHYTYIENIRDSVELLKRQQAFLSDLIERAMSSSNPYSMDRLGYWIKEEEAAATEEVQDEEPYQKYDEMVGYFDAVITSGKGKLENKNWLQRESELPPPQYYYFHHAADTRRPDRTQESTVLRVSLLFPEDKNALGRAQRRLLRNITHWIDHQEHNLYPTLTVPATEEKQPVRLRRIQRHFDALPTREVPQSPSPTLFPFTEKEWCVYYLRLCSAEGN